MRTCFTEPLLSEAICCLPTIFSYTYSCTDRLAYMLCAYFLFMATYSRDYNREKQVKRVRKCIKLNLLRIKDKGVGGLQKSKLLRVFRNTVSAVADPVFPRRGGGANPQGGGANLLFCPNFPENCMKMKEFGPRGGGGASLAPPLDPPMLWFQKSNEIS